MSQSPALADIADKRNDITNDNISDLIGKMASGSAWCLYRWSGDGNGHIESPELTVCNVANFSNFAATGDNTGDGNGDLYSVNTVDNCLYRWNGTAFGGLVGPFKVGSCSGWSQYKMTLAGAGDLNNDGRGDLVGINSNNCLVRWFGNGSGGVVSGTQLGCGWTPYRASLTGAGDLDNDGDADLVAINTSNWCLYRWLGNGSGGVGSGTPLGCGWSPYAGGIAGMGELHFFSSGAGDLLGRRSSNDSMDGCLFRWSGDDAGRYEPGGILTCFNGVNGGDWSNIVFAR